MDMDIISVCSDSEDEAVPPSSSQKSTSSSQTSTLSKTSTLWSPRYSNYLCEPSILSRALAAEVATSNSDDSTRGGRKNKQKQTITYFFPVIKDLMIEFRAVFGTRHTQARVMKAVGSYLRCLRILQEQVHKFPNKCRLLSKNVSRTLLLLRGLSIHFAETPSYMHRVCELLGMYTFLELRFATAFTDSKIKIAERIIANINLHFEKADISYILRIFSHIPYMSIETEIVTKVFQRLIPEPVVMVKNEFCDRLYIQYLIVFNHWKDAETMYEDQQKVIAFANRFMKPRRSLKSNLLYARHLPCYVTREDATSYFLTNLVFITDLKNASLADSPEDQPTVIDLSDDIDEPAAMDMSEIEEIQPTAPINTVKHEKEQVVATVDLTEVEDEAPWLTKLVRKAVELEVKLPRIVIAASTENRQEVPIIELDSSDDETWAYNEDELAARLRNVSTNEVDSESRNSFQRAYSNFDMSMDIPDDSTDKLLRALTQHIEKRIVPPEDSTPNENNLTSPIKQKRVTFEGIIDNELNPLPSSSSSVLTSEDTTSPANVPAESPSNMEVTESIIEEPDATPANNLAEETSVMEDSTDKENETNRSVVANILKEFAEVSLNNYRSDDVPVQSTSVDIVIDNNEVQKDAVTLSLDTFTNVFESSEESDETFLSHYDKPPIKTYLRKALKKSENKPEKADTLTSTSFDNSEKVDIENNNEKSMEAAPPEEDDTNKTPNVLFSGKVISLRDDESTLNGNLTPSYLKVPESVEVSSQGSNVVFSMQGRRLSSFPALELTSLNEPPMHDFESDFFIEGDKTTAPKTILSTKAKGDPEVEKPKRRSVWFSDKPEIHEIAPREISKSPNSQSSINTLTSTINKINANKQQYQPSTSYQPDINANNSAKPPTNILKRTLPITTTPTSPDTAALKSAQEQDLVQRLFPELFVPANKQHNRKLFKTTTLVKATKNKKKNTLIANNSNTTVTSDSKFNHYTTQIDRGRKSVTPVPGKQSLSEFDKYLQNLEKKRSKIISNPNDTPKREKSRKPRNSKKAPLNVITKSLVDITNDIKLTKMRPVVVVERLSETVFRAKMYRNVKSNSDTIRNETCTEPTQTVSSVEFLLKLPTNQTPIVIESVTKTSTVKAKTKSLSDILTDAVEQEITTPINKELPLLDTDMETTASTADAQVIQIIEKEKQSPPSESIPKPTDDEGKSCEAPAEEPSIPEKVPDEEELKPQIESEPLKTELKPIKMEQEAESLETEVTKKSTKPIASRTVIVNEIKTVSESPLRIDASTETENLALEVEKSMTPNTNQESDKNLPPNTKQVSDICTETETIADRIGVANADEQPPPNTKELNPPISAAQPKAMVITESEQEANQTTSARKHLKVRLKRFNCDQFKVVSNTALNDLSWDMHANETQSSEDTVILNVVNSDSDNESTCSENDNPKQRRARKKQVLKRIFDRVENKDLVSRDEDALTVNCNHHRRLIAVENNQIGFNGAATHNIDSINTPPPTPPSPSLSPSIQSAHRNPAIGDSLVDSLQADTRKAKPESNNNVRSSLPPLRRQHGGHMLSNYLSSSSDMIQEFRKHANMPTEVEIDSNFLALFYEYLVERKDVRSMQEINKIMPLLKTRVFSSHDSEPSLQRRRFQSCNLPSLAQGRSRKFSSTEGSNNGGSSNEGSWSSIASKRRKTICSDSHYLVHSPDFLLDEEICSSPKEADSPTIEVMRLHTGVREVQPKITSTIVSSAVAEAVEEVSTAHPVPSPVLFSDCSSPTHRISQNVSAVSTPVQSEFYMDNECGSPSRRTNCESPPEISRMAVSRTYSKRNMVQHVFVPPEIEKCIEEQDSTAIEETNTVASTSNRKRSKTSSRSCTKARKIRRIIDSSTSDDDDDDDNDEDYDYEKEKNNDDEEEEDQKKKVKKSVATTSVRIVRRKPRASRHRKLRKH